MKANKLLLAARHARASGAPIETFAEDTSEGQQMTPVAVQLPFKAELPSLGGATAWLNSPPLSVADLRGKVVLIDFWTYTCINWLRTLPYVRTWAEKYQEHGVVVIGVHTPEFSFEHDLENVCRAAQDMRVAYPIAIDNDYAIWHAFTNHYWPALYLVDVQGHLRYHHFGEGAYAQSEMILQHLLAEAGIGGIAHELVSVDGKAAEAAADWGDCRLHAWHGDGDPLPLLRYGAHPRGAGQGTLLAGYARRACPSNEGRVVEVAYYEAGPFSLSCNTGGRMLQSTRTTGSADQRETGQASRLTQNSSNQPNGGPGGSAPQGTSPNRRISWLRWLIFIIVINLLFYAPLLFSSLSGQQQTITLSYTSFLQQVQQGNVKDVTLTGHALSGDFKTPLHQQQSGTGNTTVAYSQFTSYVPETGDPTLLPTLEKNGVQVTAQPVQTPWWQTALTILLNALPLLLLVYFGYMALRSVRQSQQAGGLFGLGRSRAKLYNEERPSTTFADVAGADEAKADLREEIDFLREPQRYLAIGAHIPKGVLLVGPPGTGKTLLARAVAGEANVPFYSASGSDFVELFVGLGASRVRDLFEQARKNAPCIIFLDEIDAIGRTRSGASGFASNDEREQTLEQLLVEMDGFESNQTVVVLAATNRADVLDPALLRPGRFDRQITVDLPERRGREAILQIHTRNVPLAADVNLADLARGTPGFSGADLENLVNEAALAAARRGQTQVSRQDFDNALDKLLLGGKREALMDERERRIVAYHEGGHALVAAVLPDVDPLYKVTIMPRGRSLGVTQFRPDDDRRNLPRTYLLERLAVALGGRSAEELALGDITTGAQNDLKEASQLARRMVSEWGMGEQTGPVIYDLSDGSPSFSQQPLEGHERVFSEVTAERLDAEVERLIAQAHQQARSVLTAHREALDRLAQALLQEEVLEREQVLAILNGGQNTRGGAGSEQASQKTHIAGS